MRDFFNKYLSELVSFLFGSGLTFSLIKIYAEIKQKQINRGDFNNNIQIGNIKREQEAEK